MLNAINASGRRSRTTSPRWWVKRGACGLLAVSAVLFPTLSAGGHPSWFARPFQYVVINQDVRGILTEFGRNMGVPVILSDKVGGRVRGEVIERTKSKETAGEFLTRLAEANGLTWYFDGSILYMSVDQEFSTQLVEVGTLTSDAIVAELRRLALMDDRFAVRSAGDVGLISVSGPPAFVAIVRQVIEKLRPPPTIAGDDPRVRVFRGGAPAEVVRTPPEVTRTPPLDVAQSQSAAMRGQRQNEAAREQSGKK